MSDSPLAAWLVAPALALLVTPGAASAPSSEPTGDLDVWDARHAEHLLNRFGFGAGPEEIELAVSAGLSATVERLIVGAGVPLDVDEDALDLGSPVPLPIPGPPVDRDDPLLLETDFYLDKGEFRKFHAMRGFGNGWIGRMVDGTDPLRDRMAIFWHGHFVSSFREVGNPVLIVDQLSFLRDNALSDLGTLVRGIARDSAMLEYLNNDLNVKQSPNENWARELMELFTLGDGNYTEDDIKEAARAFSGWTKKKREFRFARVDHDYGPKTVLGVTGNLDGDDVIDIVLSQPACGRFIAGKLIQYFEGVAPGEARLEKYAELLRSTDFDLTGFLRALAHDADFYREEVVGTRVAAPVEHFVGLTRRLGLSPEPDMIYVLASVAGQRLFEPPNVKGWESGLGWLTTSRVMQRSNLSAVLIGQIPDHVQPYQTLQRTMAKGRRATLIGAFRDYLALIARLENAPWKPELAFVDDLRAAGVESDRDVIRALLDRVLAVDVDEAVVTELVEFAGELRGDDTAGLLAPESDELLRTLLHTITSLPEAQAI